MWQPRALVASIARGVGASVVVAVSMIERPGGGVVASGGAVARLRPLS